MNIMNSIIKSLLLATMVILISCEKDEEVSERFRLLTDNLWTSDSLLINGLDASGPGELLENFKGQANFREDGTGSFGGYEGTWRFANSEKELVILSDSLPVPQLSTNILELSQESLKVTTSFPNFQDPSNPILQIRLTFKAL